jgi:hypothetical protein
MGLIYAPSFVSMNYSQTRKDLYAEVRAVDVSADDGDAGPSLPVLRDCEGKQGTLVPNGVVKRYYHPRWLDEAACLVK